MDRDEMAPLLVVGIDFGTTYSGWSYSFKHDFELDPIKVATESWKGNRLLSHKAPTCVLIEPDGKTFSAFGYDAENRYSSLVEEGKHDKWYYFRRFKMKLYNQDITRDMDIEDETGKKLNAKLVFMAVIRFLKDDLLIAMKHRIKGEIKPEDISWVLTVPAIWNDGAKQFMREAAESAGISSDQLIIALEPEAAAIYCRFLRMEKGEHQNSLATFKTGSKVLIVDAGGGTVDLAVQEVAENGCMKNIYKASGGYWGGTKVDDAYLEFLEDMLGKDSIEELKRSHMEDYMSMISDFELKKRTFDLSKTDKPVVFRVPYGLLAKGVLKKDIQEVINDSSFGSMVSVKKDKMEFKASVVTDFFKAQCDSITDHVSNLLDKSTIDDIAAIVLVGGFSNCHLLQHAMTTKFNNHTIIIPNNPELAVLTGAVIFGHNPELISQRVSKYTYGVDVVSRFIQHVHEEAYKITHENGYVYCDKVFSTHITAGQYLVAGETQVEKVYTPFHSRSKAITVHVYYTFDPVPMYVTDMNCILAGELTVPLEGSGTYRSINIRMIYGGTEIVVEATEVATGKVRRLKIDFLRYKL